MFCSAPPLDDFYVSNTRYVPKVELYYVFATVWGREHYALYGILMIVFLILIAGTSEHFLLIEVCTSHLFFIPLQ